MKSMIIAAGAGASVATALVLRFSVRVPLTAQIRPPLLTATLPPLWLWIVAVVAGCLAGIVLGGRLADERRDKILWPLWIPGLAAAAYIPGALTLFPALSAFSGPFLDVVLAGSAAAALWRGLAALTRSFPLGAGHVAVVSFVLFGALGHHLQQRVGISGDEPHYLLITYSLLKDHDLAVADNYASGDYLHFYRGKIGPHLAYGSAYSVHGVGLPLLLLPGFALAGLRGVVLTEALLGALLAGEIFKLATGLGAGRAAGCLAVIGLVGTAPGLFLCVSAYPELPAALLVIAAFRKAAGNFPPGPAGALLWGLGFGLLPFFHMKYIPLALVLASGAMLSWSSRRWWVAVGTVTGLGVLLLYFWALFGNPNPLASYGTQRVFIERIPLGLAGLLFDQEFGLLTHAPVYFVGLAGAGALLARRPRLTLWMLMVFASVALPGAAHPLWSGGTSPPARLLFPVLPLLAVAGATLWRCESPRGIASWLPPLLIASVCLGAFMALGPGQPLYLNHRDGTGTLWEALGGSWDLTHYLPSLVLADPRSVALAAAGVLLLVGGLVAQWKQLRRVPGPFGLALLAVLVVDTVSPGTPAEGSRRRWMGRLLEELAAHPAGRFVSLPSGRRLSHSELLRRVELPLHSWGTSGAGRLGETLRLPSGEFELRSDALSPLRLCNGEGCFARASAPRRFTTRLALAHFHVRSEPSGLRLALVPLRVGPPTPVALHTLGFASGLRIHGLDDEAFLDPKGYWVRAGARSRFAVECAEASSCTVSLVNGPRENWIELEYGRRNQRFPLGPGELKRVKLPMERGFCLLSVRSRSGFRPSELDPSRRDRRPLGVFLTAPKP